MNSLKVKSAQTLRLTGSEHDILTTRRILQEGGVVALPTETVYGLAANGLDAKSLLQIFAAKGRPLNNPLILHTDSLKKALKLFDLTELAHISRVDKLARAFWPGPLTIVAKKTSQVPNEATGNLATVGVRIPKHPITLAILAGLDFPLAMPSANISTRPSPTSIKHVLKTLDGRISGVVDGGTCAVGIESTIVQIDTERPEILRSGMVSLAMLEQCLLEPVVHMAAGVHKKPRAPGLMYLHYAPAVASVKLISKVEAKNYWQSPDIILALTKDFLELTNGLGLRPNTAINMTLSDKPELYAQELYAVLYACERMPHLNLLIISPPPSPEWLAILDRLSRSADTN